jgi:hypothetical protein
MVFLGGLLCTWCTSTGCNFWGPFDMETLQM